MLPTLSPVASQLSCSHEKWINIVSHKVPTCCRRHFEMYFLQWKCWNLQQNLIELRFWWSNWRKISIGLDNGLGWNKRHLNRFTDAYILKVTGLLCITPPPLDKMAAIFQTVFSAAFLTKIRVFWLQFQWSLSLMVQLTITQHWFK